MTSAPPPFPEADMPLDPAGSRPSSAAPSRWTRPLLVASLGLNLLVAGLFVGDALTGGGRGHRPRPVEMTLGPFARALGEGDRRAILEDLRGDPDLRPLSREEFEAGLARIRAAVAAEPFEGEAVLAAIAAQSEKVDRSERAVQEALVAHLAAMSPRARAAFAERLAVETPGR